MHADPNISRVMALEPWHGVVTLEKTTYRPLEKVRLEILPPERGAREYLAVWHDAQGREYGRKRGAFRNGKAAIIFDAGGAAGMQYITVCYDPDENPGVHHRLLNFFLEAETAVRCGHPLCGMPGYARRLVRLNNRKYALEEGTVNGYTTADSGNTLDFWLRDMYYAMGATAYWDPDMETGFEAFWRRQSKDGQFADWIDAAGQYGRMSSEADLEYIAVLALESVWMVRGDNEFLKKYLPVVENGIACLTSNSLHWDEASSMVRRGHTCCAWDFDTQYDEYRPEISAVVASCDQSGLYAAYLSLSRMQGALGNLQEARAYSEKAERLRARCRKALWNGTFYRHHVHLNLEEHVDFDEATQLSMGNTWMMTRGMADEREARSVIGEYEKRLRETGHQFPWWSLEPGYPVSMGKVLADNASYLQPGGYCNGGLMPWVGGELCLAAFQNGREDFAWMLLDGFARFLHENQGRLYIWYWPDMQPGFRTSTANTTSHDGWAMGCWMKALAQGLAGFETTEPGMRAVRLSPRWAAAGIRKAEAVFHHPATGRYTACRFRMTERTISIDCTGCAHAVAFRVLLPAGRRVHSVRVCGRETEYRTETIAESAYVCFEARDLPVAHIRIRLDADSQERNDPR